MQATDLWPLCGPSVVSWNGSCVSAPAGVGEVMEGRRDAARAGLPEPPGTASPALRADGSRLPGCTPRLERICL